MVMDGFLAWRESAAFMGFLDSRSPFEETEVFEKTKTNDTELPANRREFLALAALAAAGLGAMLPAAGAAAATGGATDFTRWLDSIGGKQRLVLDMREPNGGMAFAWAWVFLFTAPQAYGVTESDLGAAIVMRHNAIPIALADSAWAKYKLGEFFKIDDWQTGKPAVRNPFYLTMSDDFLPDMAMQKLLDRGVRMVACDMAIHYYTGVLAKQTGLKHEDIKADWNSAVLPNIAHAPSGVVACQGAVARGCSYVFAG
jgi:hypothetical protein